MDYLREFNIVSVILRLALGLLAGGAVGYGRARKKQNAGLRTYMLVSLGATMTMLISMYEYEMLNGQWAWAQEYADLKFDGSRYSAQVIQGIGFLAAGTIIGISHKQISGLTTAIGLFASAAMGIAAGTGFYEAVIIGVVLVIVSMEFLYPLEGEYKRHHRNIDVHVEFDHVSNLDLISDTIRAMDAQIFDIDVEDPEKDGKELLSAIFSVKLSEKNPSHSALLSSIAELDCVYSIQEIIS